MRILIVVAALNFQAFAHPGPSDLLKSVPGEILRNEVVEFKPKPEHHFSLEAPQKCAGGAPVEASARVIKCQFTNPGSAEAVLNVCDDKKTFCKPVTVSLLVAEKAAREPVRLVRNQYLNKDLKKSLVPGFEFATPEEAKKEAKKRGKPVLIMISTDWCPPCNEAKEYLMVSDVFNKVTKDFYKIYVDGDSLGAAEWDKTVPFSYYPSFVLLNSDLEEIARYNGKLREFDFRMWVEKQKSFIDDPIKDVRERVFARKENSFTRRMKDWWNRVRGNSRRMDKVRLLHYALDQDDKLAIELLIADKNTSYPESIKAKVINYEISKLAGSDKPEDKKRRIKLFNDLVEINLSLEDWAESVLRMCEDDEAECKALTKNIPLREESLQNRLGFTPPEMASALAEEYYYLAQLFARIKDPVREKEFAGKCVVAYQTLKALSKLDLPRSAQQGLVPCLEQAGRFKEAEQVLSSLVEMYPYEPTFMIRMARMYRKQKKLDLALKWINKAETVAYGYNWFSLVLIKSDILLDLKKKGEAKSLLNAALAELRLDEDRDSRNQTVVARLRAAEAKISN